MIHKVQKHCGLWSTLAVPYIGDLYVQFINTLKTEMYIIYNNSVSIPEYKHRLH
jgi:hypothetical protein